MTVVTGLLVFVLGIVALLGCAAAYLWCAGAAHRRNPVSGWSAWRSVSFLGGLLLLAAAVVPPLDTLADADFRAHMAQHLLIGMYAPLALVLGAPTTVLLRTLRPADARRLVALLRSRAVRAWTHPFGALLLSSGGLAALYFTPLWRIVTTNEAGHGLLHAHFLASGCLFAHAIAGPDPSPRRPPVRTRLVYLGVAIAAHAVMAQLIYGGLWTQIAAPASQLRGGAQLMYYGGDIGELLLAAALVATWRPRVGQILVPPSSTDVRRGQRAGPSPLGRTRVSARQRTAAFSTAARHRYRAKFGEIAEERAGRA